MVDIKIVFSSYEKFQLIFGNINFVSKIDV